MEVRNVIVHAHIFKNAGTTFDSTLRSNFGEDFIDHREDGLIRNDKEFLPKYLTEHENVKAFSSHSIYHRPEDFGAVVLHKVYFLRQPIERMKSVYNFEKKQPEEISLGAKMAKELDFAEYVAWRMQDGVPATIRNLQTIFLAAHGANHKKSFEYLYESAVKNLMDTPLMGVVDRYDESMVVFEEYLRSYFVNIDLSYIRRNVTDTDLHAGLDEKIAKILSKLSLSLQEEVQLKNAYDLKLYDLANRQLDEKISKIDNFDSKLKDFKVRCSEQKE